MAVVGFADVEEAALRRHGPLGVDARLGVPKTADELAAMPDDRHLSLMSLRIFRAGLKHELVDRKWPAFEEMFRGFELVACARLYDEDYEAMVEDRRLIRHMGKLRAVRANAAAMLEIAGEHGSIGRWLGAWPVSDIVGLWDELGRRFQQLGGNSAAAFLRMAGKDTFILTDHVGRALARLGVVGGQVKTRVDRRRVQDAFNGWMEETGRPLCQLSQILAMSGD
jgi:3-methyladenine DNA glycosylase Tag